MDTTTPTATPTAPAPIQAPPEPTARNVTVAQRMTQMARARTGAPAPGQPAPASAASNGHTVGVSAPPAEGETSTREGTPPAPALTEPTAPAAAPAATAAAPAPALPSAPTPAAPSDNPQSAIPNPPSAPEFALDDQAASTSTDSRPPWLEAILADPDIPKVKKELIGRVHELATEKNKWKTMAEQAELARAESAAADNPQSAIPNPQSAAPAPLQAIDGQIQNVAQWLTWLDSNPDGGKVNLATAGQPPQEVEVTPEQIAPTKTQLTMRLSRLNGERAALNMQLQQQFHERASWAKAEAAKSYPWMGKTDSPEFVRAQQVLQQFPGVRNDPDWPMVVGDYVAGVMLRESRAARPVAPVPPPFTRPKLGGEPAPVVAAAAGVPPPPVDPVQKAVQEAETKYRETGSLKDRQKLFALRRQAKTAA